MNWYKIAQINILSKVISWYKKATGDIHGKWVADIRERGFHTLRRLTLKELIRDLNSQGYRYDGSQDIEVYYEHGNGQRVQISRFKVRDLIDKGY